MTCTYHAHEVSDKRNCAYVLGNPPVCTWRHWKVGFTEWFSGLGVEQSPNTKDMIQSIPGLISCAGGICPSCTFWLNLFIEFLLALLYLPNFHIHRDDWEYGCYMYIPSHPVLGEYLCASMFALISSQSSFVPFIPFSSFTSPFLSPSLPSPSLI